MKIKRLFLLFLAILFAVLIILLPRLIVINEYLCRTQYGPCQQNILDNLVINRGKKYGEVKKRILNEFRQNKLISDISIQFKLPDKLDVYLILTKPYFAIKTPSSDKLILVNEKGESLSYADKSSLPLVDIETPSLLENQSETLEFYLEIYRLIAQIFKIAEAKIFSDRMELKLNNNPTLIFPSEGDAAVLVGAARLIIEQLNIGRQNLKIDKPHSEVVVDLRFRNPVVR